MNTVVKIVYNKYSIQVKFENDWQTMCEQTNKQTNKPTKPDQTKPNQTSKHQQTNKHVKIGASPFTESGAHPVKRPCCLVVNGNGADSSTQKDGK